MDILVVALFALFFLGSFVLSQAAIRMIGRVVTRFANKAA